MPGDRRFARVTTAIVILVLETAIAEAVARVWALAPEPPASTGYVADALTAYRPRPFSEFTTTTQEYTYIRRHNSVGFRDVEHTIAKPHGVFRIFALGDSFTYGAGVDLAETYLARLEDMLNRRQGVHPRIEIIKAAIPGFFPEVERILLEQDGMRYEPDLVLVAFQPNDLEDTHRGIGALFPDAAGALTSRDAAQLAPSVRWLARHSHLVRLEVSRFLQHRPERGFREQDNDPYRANGFYEADWRKVESEYARMSAIAAAGHGRFAITHIPQTGPWQARHRYPAMRLADWSRRNGALFIDVLPALESAPVSPAALYYRDGHCTPAGHEVIAQAIFTSLTASGIVP